MLFASSRSPDCFTKPADLQRARQEEISRGKSKWRRPLSGLEAVAWLNARCPAGRIRLLATRQLLRPERRPHRLLEPALPG